MHAEHHRLGVLCNLGPGQNTRHAQTFVLRGRIVTMADDDRAALVIREELLADLLGDVVKRIQIPAEVADWIAEGLRDSQSDLEQTRKASVAQLVQRRGSVQAKLDRGYDDYLEGRISAAFWARKPEEWEAALASIGAELSRQSGPTPAFAATGDRIFRTRENGHFRYLEQPFEERRRLLDTVLSNCTFDRGSLYPTYSKPFDLFANGTRFRVQFETHVAVRVPSGSRFAQSPS